VGASGVANNEVEHGQGPLKFHAERPAIQSRQAQIAKWPHSKGRRDA
jgi:hypothetical protein